MRKARPAVLGRALKEIWFQVTLVHSLLSSRHARLERGALVLPPHVRFAPRSAICTLQFKAGRLRRSYDLAKPETRFGLSLLPGDRIRCRIASEGSKLLP